MTNEQLMLLIGLGSMVPGMLTLAVLWVMSARRLQNELNDARRDAVEARMALEAARAERNQVEGSARQVQNELQSCRRNERNLATRLEDMTRERDEARSDLAPIPQTRPPACSPEHPEFYPEDGKCTFEGCERGRMKASGLCSAHTANSSMPSAAPAHVEVNKDTIGAALSDGMRNILISNYTNDLLHVWSVGRQLAGTTVSQVFVGGVTTYCHNKFIGAPLQHLGEQCPHDKVREYIDHSEWMAGYHWAEAAHTKYIVLGAGAWEQ